MGKVIIHIGMHKTGTSFLQKEVFPKLENTFYAHNNQFFVPWKEQLPINSDNMLLSYEGFSGFPWDNKQSRNNWLQSFDLNIKQLKKFFPDAIIIIFFRKHGDLITSLYKQYLHEGGELCFNDFYGDNKIIDKKDLNIKHRLDFIKDNFNKVYFLNYQSFLEIGTDYLRHFLNKELSLELHEAVKPNKTNVSVSGPKKEVLRHYNIIYNRLPRILKKVLVVLRLQPRKFVQQKLAFWQAKDNDSFINLKEEINKEFENDWAYFVENQYK